MSKIKIDKSWTLFLDRDGVINEKIDNDYVKNINEFKFKQGVLEIMPFLNKNFNRIVVVTNQQGISKGIMTEKDLSIVHNHLKNEIEKVDGRIDKFYFCPELAINNPIDRKPNIGMGIKAKEDFPEINFEKTIMVGDSMSDMKFGKRLNMTTIYIKSKKILSPDDEKYIDYICDKLYDIKEIISL